MKKVFFILFLVPLILCSQQNRTIDSLLNVYNNLPDNADKVYILDRLHYATLYNDVNSAKTYALHMLKLATKLNETEEIGYANFNIGVSYRSLGQKDSAVIFFKKAKSIFETNGYSKGESLVNNAFATLALESGNHDLAMELTQKNISIARANKDSSKVGVAFKFMGLILREKGDLEKALDYSYKAIKLLTDPYFSLERADALSEIGRIESELGNFDSAIKYLHEAKAIYEQENDLDYLAQSLMNIGNNYYNIKAYDQAEKTLTKALLLARKVPSPTIEGLTLINLGRTYIRLNQPDKALNYLRTAMDIGEKNDRIMDVIRASYFISEFYYEKNNSQMAMQYANNAIKLADSVELPNMLSLSYELRSNIYKKRKSFGPALEDFTTFKTIQDSLYHIEKTKEIEKLKTIYETEKKELQIAQQETAISLLEQEAKINTLQKILLGSGLVLSLLFFGLGFYAIRQNMKRTRLEKERVKAELDFKKKELTTHALHLAKKNEVLENLKQQAKTLKATSKESKGYQDLIKTINFDQQDDKNWENFTQYFEQVHKDFSSNVKLKYPEVTKNELRFMALIKMNMSSKEIATILNISADGVKKARQRLRKKMDLTPQDSLENAVLAI